MRKEFVEGGSRGKAEELCPWASEIIELDYGFMCFESVTDAEIWDNQK